MNWVDPNKALALFGFFPSIALFGFFPSNFHKLCFFQSTGCDPTSSIEPHLLLLLHHDGKLVTSWYYGNMMI
jgi:hypothetical protein